MALSWKSDPELAARLEDEADLLRLRREAKRIVDAEERPPVEWPEAASLKEILAQPPDPVRWRVEGWLPAGGRVVLAGQAKAGKTHVAANLVRCLVDGTPWLGRDPVAPVVGKVAVIDFEMTARQLFDWYRELGIESTDRVLVVPMRGRAAAFDLRDDDTRTRWSRLLVEHEVEFVVWDCLRPVVDALGLDENHDASSLLTAFDAMRADAGDPEALVLHHMGHSNERARGDSGIIGWSDANWKLVLGEGGEYGPRWLKAAGRDVVQAEVQLEQHAETRRLTVASAGMSREAARNNAATEVVLEVLRAAEEPMNKTTIVDEAVAAGIPRKLAREALGILVAVRQVIVEQGDKNAQLHRLSPALEEVSSPVRRVLPLSAGDQASLSAAASSGGLANTQNEGVRPGELKLPDLGPGGMTQEQKELIERLRATRPSVEAS